MCRGEQTDDEHRINHVFHLFCPESDFFSYCYFTFPSHASSYVLSLLPSVIPASYREKAPSEGEVVEIYEKNHISQNAIAGSRCGPMGSISPVRQYDTGQL